MTTPGQGDNIPWIILLNSIHHVLAAERAFKERNVWCDLVPVPRDLSSDCGMAVAFRGADLETVRQLLADARIRPQSLHRPSPDGFERVTMEPR